MMRGYTFQKLSAAQEISLLRGHPRMINYCVHLGLNLEDALALAYNSTLLYLALECEQPLASPRDVLERFSLSEIAALCDDYAAVKEGTLEFGADDNFPHSRGDA